MPGKKIKLLYLDSNNQSQTRFKNKFGKNYTIYVVKNESEAIELLDRKTIHIIVSALTVNGSSGLKSLKSLVEKHPEPKRIIISEEIVLGEVIEAVNKTHIYAYISFKWQHERIEKILDKAFLEFNKELEERAYNFRLQKTNEQLEFMLREKLVS